MNFEYKIETPDSSWDEIFDFHARKNGRNYYMLKNWLKKHYHVPRKRLKANKI